MPILQIRKYKSRTDLFVVRQQVGCRWQSLNLNQSHSTSLRLGIICSVGDMVSASERTPGGSRCP